MIINGDCLEVLKGMESNTVDCVVTSPPYWTLRKYGDNPDELGAERTFQEYIEKLILIFDEVKRVLKPSGTCWVNLGDAYSGSSGEDDTTSTNRKPKRMHKHKWRKKEKTNIQDKSLCCIPDRFKIAMVDRGWICRNDIIWYKRNSKPESVTDRFTVDYERIFFFVKSKKYYFEQQFEVKNRLVRNMRCVWDINTVGSPINHPAMYPMKLVARMIKSGCPEYICKKCGKPRERVYNIIAEKPNIESCLNFKAAQTQTGCDFTGTLTGTPSQKIENGLTDCGCNAGFTSGIVLDPFAGAGNTIITAIKMGRRYIGIEIYDKYCELINKRIERERNLFIL